MLRLTLITSLLIAAALTACTANPFASNRQSASTAALKADQLQPGETSSSQSFNLFQEGKGRLALEGQDDRTLKAVSLSGQDTNIELAFESTDGSLVRLSGNLVSQTPNIMIIDFTRSGDADASGSVRVKYDAATISDVTGNGTLDGQALAIEFAHDISSQTISGQPIVQVPTPPALPTASLSQGDAASTAASKPLDATVAAPVPLSLPSIQPDLTQSGISPENSTPIELPADRLVRPDINLSQQGVGTFSLNGQTDKSLSSASVVGRENGRVDVVLRFTDAEQVRFLGNVEQKSAGAIVINLINADTATAAGRVMVGYDGDHSIQTLSGDGMLGSQPFVVQFSQ